jgi:hypothetical protein
MFRWDAAVASAVNFANLLKPTDHMREILDYRWRFGVRATCGTPRAAYSLRPRSARYAIGQCYQ